MSAWLLSGTLAGSLVFLLVAAADRLAARGMRARGRRLWWILVPLAFLLPVRLPLFFPAHFPLPHAGQLPMLSSGAIGRDDFNKLTVAQAPTWPTLEPYVLGLWLVGVALSAGKILVPTLRAHRAWGSQRLSTDPHLLGLLEDAKAAAGVTAPIGLVVSAEVPTPALFGWLRPRLLFPRRLVDECSPRDLQAILLHELAHFRAMDIPLNWLFTLVSALHWFNPLAHLANAAWARFREEAADEAAIGWLRGETPRGYGEILLKTLRHGSGAPMPAGMLGLGESITTLKRRMHMIHHHPKKSNRALLAAAVTLLVLLTAAVSPAPADDNDSTAAKKNAEAAMGTWLEEMDHGDYAKTWTDASPTFQGAISSERWVAVSHTVRDPLGAVGSRNLASALYQESYPKPDGTTVKGPFVIAQFNSSFANLKYAIETVTFQQGFDGTWRAAGYYIKPGS